MSLNSLDVSPLFLPPINRSMEKLDRSFFQKSIELSAARIADVRSTAAIRATLTRSKDLLSVYPIKPLIDDPDVRGAKCLLLQPSTKSDDMLTWSDKLRQLADDGQVEIRPYNLQLKYEDWTMQNILNAVLPELPEDEKETPAGFSQVGHVAHINLREQYLPFKFIIAQVLLDKNPAVRTVINKTLDVGTESAFRTFPYEVLAGPDNLDVTVNEAGCEYKFNFGKVYWNSRLGTEHARIVSKFQEGEAVCDVMAGVGPFAIPAGKRRVFVHANDLNPDSYDGLKHAIQRNKVSDFVMPCCDDGRKFIRSATHMLTQVRRRVQWQPKVKVSRHAASEEKDRAVSESAKVYHEPSNFDHYVMNLPAVAVEFLDAFRGLYKGREAEFTPDSGRKLPLIHVYLFQAKRSTEDEEFSEISERVSEQIGAPISYSDPRCELELFYIRLVAPNKKMYCASFRLPATVAFADT